MSNLDHLADLLLPALIGFTLAVAYFFGVRPLLKQTPGFKQLYASEDTVLNALSVKLGGVKQKITTIFLSAAGFIVVAHDEITPFITQVGVDPAQILPKVPTWVWPVASVAVLWLIQHFRNLADMQARANAEALLNAGHPLAAPAPGLPLDTLPSPSPLASLPDKEG
jgi:hypothetical protein